MDTFRITFPRKFFLHHLPMHIRIPHPSEIRRYNDTADQVLYMQIQRTGPRLIHLNRKKIQLENVSMTMISQKQLDLIPAETLGHSLFT